MIRLLLSLLLTSALATLAPAGAILNTLQDEATGAPGWSGGLDGTDWSTCVGFGFVL
ncbi:MAG: hypothetical protein R3D98_05675 [Candidatus Krumholzibacteriia bacterium]